MNCCKSRSKFGNKSLSEIFAEYSKKSKSDEIAQRIKFNELSNKLNNIFIGSYQCH